MWQVDSSLDKTRRAIDQSIRGMSLAQLAAHAEGKWSPAQILEHLSLTYSSTVKGLGRCLAADKPLATKPTLYQRAAIALVVVCGHMPEGGQAPSFTRPKGLPAEDVVRVIQENLGQMEEIIGRCEARFGKRVKIADHPVLGPLTLPEWRKFHWVHTRHHVRQIARMRSAFLQGHTSP